MATAVTLEVTPDKTTMPDVRPQQTAPQFLCSVGRPVYLVAVYFQCAATCLLTTFALTILAEHFSVPQLLCALLIGHAFLIYGLATNQSGGSSLHLRPFFRFGYLLSPSSRKSERTYSLEGGCRHHASIDPWPDAARYVCRGVQNFCRRDSLRGVGRGGAMTQATQRSADRRYQYSLEGLLVKFGCLGANPKG